MAEQDKRRVHGFVSGRVQGVFFRASTRAVAENLGLGGWVRNLRDGRVEFVAEGDAAVVQQLLAWAAVGPDYAHVTALDVTEEPYRAEYHTFDVWG